MNLQEIIDFLQTHAVSFGIKLISAILVYYFGKLILKFIINLVRKLLEKKDVNQSLREFVLSLVNVGGLTLIIIVALGTMGIQTASFVAIIGAAGLSVGLAMQGTLSNFAAGVLILLLKPFEVGDVVDLGGIVGKIVKITIFNVELLTPDNVTIIVPNKQAGSGVVKNYSRQKIRRVDMVFGIGYGDDIKEAKKVLKEIVLSNSKVLADPPPDIFVAELADSSVNIAVRPWVKSEDYWTVKAEITEQVKEEFDKRGISIPYPHQEVYVHNVE